MPGLMAACETARRSPGNYTMARNRDPFTQALSSLRDRIQSGDIPGGRQVIVQDEARRLSLSTTPVREALARLSGEGLVERAASGGYVTLRLDAAAARERYAMRGEYIRIALELNCAALGSALSPASAFDPASPRAAIGRLFATIVCSAGNQVLWSAFNRTAGQLRILHRLEARLFDDIEREARELHDAYRKQAPAEFAEAVANYHRRRMSASGALAALACLKHEETGPGPQPDQRSASSHSATALQE